MGDSRIIQRRIKSVGSTRKITKAMELVAAVKMRRATERVALSRPYAESITGLVHKLASRISEEHHPMLTVREEKEVAVIVISSNRGLCGGFNRELVEKVHAHILQLKNFDSSVSLITVGRKAALALTNRGHDIILDFPKEDLTLDVVHLSPIVREVSEGFINGRFDAVYIAYTDYVSSLKQVPTIARVLPFGDLISSEDVPSRGEFVSEEAGIEYLFEPSANEVLSALLPKYVTTTLYQSILESEASEHSARMLAMKNASDAARDMIDDLSLQFNRARQDGITQEISEISAGMLS